MSDGPPSEKPSAPGPLPIWLATGPLAAFERRLGRLPGLYDPFRPRGSALPPRTLRPFFEWAFLDLRGVVGVLAVVSLAVGLVEVAIIEGVGRLIDAASATGPERLVAENGWLLAWLAALVLLARPATLIAQGALGSLIVTPGVGASVVWRLLRHTLGHSMRYFEDDFAGRLAQKHMQASAAVVSVAIDLLNSIGLVVSFLAGMVVALALADWRLALATLVWTGLYLVALRAVLPPIRAASKARAERRAAVSGQLVDSLGNIKTVKLFAGPGEEEAAALAALGAYREASLAFGTAVTRLRVVLALLNALAMAAMLSLGLWLWAIGAISIGAATAATMLTLRVTAMSNWVAFTALGVFSEIGTLEDALGTLARPHEITDTPDAAPAPLAPGAPPERVAFERVSFRYGGKSGPEAGRARAVEELSLAIEPGERVGLVGPSGAGKSTLVALLMRLYEVENGRVTLGGRDVRTFRQADLRARLGVVTQESALFNRSALENIRYGRPGATEAEVVAAAERARADAFLRGLRDPQGRTGYDAHLGERGVKLSGGQRQRVALARAFLKDAPILVLDEATSALDSEIEAEVLDALRALMEGRTVIAIAHRLSTIAAMDRIVVMDEGRILEQGAHAALLAEGGLYARLWARQSGGFIGRDFDAAA